MPDTTTIQDVLRELDVIIDDSIKTNSRIGLFAYVYRRTTFEIASEIALGHFEDNQRLEDFDVAFANLYLDAYRDYKNGQPVSASWAYAFDQVNESLTIVQHILLGMNAHINLDLAVAAAETMTGQEIHAIENDFNKVNDILFQITNELQDRLSRVSPLMFLIDALGKNKDELIINFSMRKARKQAWHSAKLLWSLEDEQREKAKRKIDRVVLALSRCVKSPKSLIIRFLLRVVESVETKQVSVIISKLRADPEK